jgi:hypothetical protein
MPIEIAAKMKNIQALIARRQKRLRFWKKQMAQQDVAKDQANKLSDLYSTYLLLLSRLSKSTAYADSDAAEERIQDIERELVSLFEARLLMTSDIGFASIKQ